MIEGILALILFILPSCLAKVQEPFVLSPPRPPSVDLINGTVEGIAVSSFQQDHFLGIPYAQPPVGNLRLRRSIPLSESWDQPFKATRYSPICFGHGFDNYGYEQSEDCLTLNIVRPNSINSEAKLPVMLWIHGGGHIMGGSADKRYNGSYLVEKSVEMGSPVIFVSINYRLHAWGFLNGFKMYFSGLSNLGLFDQRLAMLWVKENIEAFGGDPKKITLFGESAGGMSIGVHLTAFGGKEDGLFRAAIMESGSPTTDLYRTPDAGNNDFNRLSETLGCSESLDEIQCLREASSEDFYRATQWISTTGPVIDLNLIPQYPSQLLASGQYIHVPIISGSNTDEGFGPGPIDTNEQLVESLMNGFRVLRRSVMKELVSIYSDSPADGSPYGTGDALSKRGGKLTKKSDSIAGDILFSGASRNVVQTFSREGLAYSYRFDHLPFFSDRLDGVSHFAEVAFVFGTPDNYVNGQRTTLSDSPGDQYLSNVMQRMWISFAVNCDPNFHGVADIPFWAPYSPEEPKNMLFRNSTEGGIIMEDDTWRLEEIAFINKYAVDFRR